MRDNETLYLIWKGHADGTSIQAKRLNPDGLSFANASEPSTTLFRPTLDWEAGDTEGPWHIKQGRYNYIMYSGEGKEKNNNGQMNGLSF